MPHPDSPAILARAVHEAQAILAAYLEPGSPSDDRETLDALLGVLDREDVVRAVRDLEPSAPPHSRPSPESAA
jgi:hypothetical protein